MALRRLPAVSFRSVRSRPHHLCASLAAFGQDERLGNVLHSPLGPVAATLGRVGQALHAPDHLGYTCADLHALLGGAQLLLDVEIRHAGRRRLSA